MAPNKDRRFGKKRSRTEALAEATVPVVLSESTRVAIEKMAAECAQEMLADPTFKAQLKEIVARVFSLSSI